MGYNRYKILQRDNFRCRYCGKQAAESELQVDHVQPRSRGGSDDPVNLVTACVACNQSKRDTQPVWEPCLPMLDVNGAPDNWPRWLEAGRGIPEPIWLESPVEMQQQWAFSRACDLQDMDDSEPPHPLAPEWEKFWSQYGYPQERDRIEAFWGGWQGTGSEQCQRFQPNAKHRCSPHGEACVEL